jgi:hypothetical protein
VNDKESSEQADAVTREWFQEQVEKANLGDHQALARLREFLDANPSFWRRLGDLAGHAEAAWLELISRGETHVRESIRRESGRLREELLGNTATPVERLMVDQIVVLQLEVQYLQIRAADVSGGTTGQVSLVLKRLESAQRRYLAAIKTLTLVRKLALSGDARARLRVFSGGRTG